MKIGKKIAYVSGDLGISIAFFAVGFFFMYYLTDIVGMSPYLAGISMAVGMFWDAVTDPIMGLISDRTRTKMGRKRVYILFGAIPLGVSFSLLWIIPTSSTELVQFILATLLFLLFKTAYTVVTVPYMSLLPVITNDYNERTQISGMRAFTSQFGTILGGVSALIVGSFSNEIVGLRGMGIGFGGMVAFLLLVSAWSVKGLEKDDLKDKRKVPTLKDMVSALWEKNFMILVGMYFIGGIATTSMIASFPYFTEHVMGSDGLSTFGLAAFILAGVAAIPVWVKLSKKFEKKRLLLVSTLATAVILVLIGVIIGKGDTLQFFILVAVAGLFMSAYFIIPYSLVPDTVDLSELRTGKRQESLHFSIWVFIHKIGLAVAPLIMGVMMGTLGYDGDLDVQTSGGMLSIRLTFGLLPAVFFVLTGLIVQFYGITRSRFEEIKEELDRTRSEHSEDGVA